MTEIDSAAQDQIFRQARTFSHWTGEAVTADQLQAIWNLARLGPTGANCLPARVVFAVSPEAKARLKPCLAAGNVAQTMAAPATMIIGYDLDFPQHLARLFPHVDAKRWFEGNDALVQDTAYLNGALQAAYLIIAARSLGLDCGPMGGFDRAKTDQAFFAESRVKSFLLVNLGKGERSKLHPRHPRLSFAEACRID